MDGLSQAEQRELNTRIERKQVKEFMTMYSKLVQRCFDHCVNDFTTKSLISREENCVLRCVDKYMRSNERIGERFQEQNAAMMQSGALPGR
ncbi:protein transporter tim9 [Elasticomyces elasticus]|uniref:Mitochondrial import inner membrane translocase subunit n=1 Tax=Exophiala sideris TaxID=1016849 RepID=A0A0D1W5Z3_9EURO|nr:protein transporter tim9 [Elasticomyces elasticus]KAK5039562.1 protein transporter tim9 [Exophiala sideris]KAK5067939.1 protein transporter tim9 [Exophiala sideris]KAK5187241.1 protein transporter tim9 [Eurotiomycetes sp. CCFEE 6388]KIV84030.1 mitochondrial import inner membrane translocase subunit tim9 [Exophiala sideris]